MSLSYTIFLDSVVSGSPGDFDLHQNDHDNLTHREQPSLPSKVVFYKLHFIMSSGTLKVIHKGFDENAITLVD